MPEISFVITTFNYSKYIEECVNSILSQELFEDNEIIIIDDGSNDNTSEILKIYLKKDFIKYIKINNSGVEYASNLGISNIKTKYFVRVDGDDSLNKNYLNYINSAINDDYDFIYSDYNKINEISNIIESKKLPKFDKNEIFRRGDFLATGTAFKKKSFDHVNGYDTKNKNCGLENYSLILRLIKSNFKGKHISNTLFNYRIHAKNMSKIRRNAIIEYGNKLTSDLLNKPYEVNTNHPYGLKF